MFVLISLNLCGNRELREVGRSRENWVVMMTNENPPKSDAVLWMVCAGLCVSVVVLALLLMYSV